MRLEGAEECGEEPVGAGGGGAAEAVPEAGGACSSVGPTGGLIITVTGGISDLCLVGKETEAGKDPASCPWTSNLCEEHSF